MITILVHFWCNQYLRSVGKYFVLFANKCVTLYKYRKLKSLMLAKMNDKISYIGAKSPNNCRQIRCRNA